MDRKEKDHGYHCAALARPVTSWKIAGGTSTAMEARSSEVQDQLPASAERHPANSFG